MYKYHIAHQDFELELILAGEFDPALVEVELRFTARKPVEVESDMTKSSNEPEFVEQRPELET